jgi:predicted nucleic acid-binding Zn ribbon protein
LAVNCDASAWLYELSTKKREILKGLAGHFKGRRLKDIRFRIGQVKIAGGR